MASRLAFAVLLWLAFGLAATAVVAWLGAHNHRADLNTLAPTATIPSWVSKRLAGAERTDHYVSRSALTTWTVHSGWNPDGTCDTVRVVTGGWPFRALSAWDSYTIRPGHLDLHGGFTDVPSRNAFVIPWDFWSKWLPHWFPLSYFYAPVFPGLVINSALYAAAAFCAFHAARKILFLIRASRRRRRGLCVRCGYPVSGLPRCPECGSMHGKTAL